MTSPPAGDRADRAFLGHPKGLGYLAFTEAWERFSYYGMQSLLVLYMGKQLLLPGHIENVAGFPALNAFVQAVYSPGASPQAIASAIFGLYTSLVYLTPILGGYVADRLLGKTRTVVLGALLMAAGHFMMAFEASFLPALLALILGCGCFKGNIASQVGGLYAPADKRRADAFQIFYLGINAGVIAAPLVAGTLGEEVGWHWGFGAAGVGMLASLAIYLSGRRWLPPDPPIVRGPVERPKLKAGEGRVVLLLAALLPVMAASVLINQQIFNAYLSWADTAVDLSFMGRKLPTTWLITLDTLTSVGFLALMVVFWRLWARRFPEPDEIGKMTLGTAISVLGALSLAAGAAQAAAAGGQVSLAWCVAFHLLNSIAFANIMPVSLALFARAAPAAISATIIGVYYLHLFAANQTVGWLGTLIERLGPTRFWLLHAAIAAASAAAFWAVGRAWGPMLRRERQA